VVLCEPLFLVDGRFRTRREAGLTYPSQSMGELDRVLERKRKLEARLKGTGDRGPARGRRRKQAEERLEEIERALSFAESGLARRDQDRRAHARERRRRSSQRLEAARAAMTQRIDTQAESVITTFRSLVDGLKAGTISSAPSPLPPTTTSSNPDAQVDIGILQRLGFVQPGKMLGDQLGWSEAWIPEPKRRLFFIIDLRDRKRPCAVFVVCDPERQAHQLFALERTNEICKRPLWAPGISLYLPQHDTSKHHYLLPERPIFLFELTLNIFYGRSFRRFWDLLLVGRI
jgi:hypothetical protein